MPTLFAPMERVLTHTDPPAPIPGKIAAAPQVDAELPWLERPRKAAKVLAVVSSLLWVPGAYAALIGWFLLVPPVLLVTGSWLMVSYWRAALGKAVPSKRFWDASLAYNILLLAGNLVLLAMNAGDFHEGVVVLVLTATWQAAAIHLSRLAYRKA